MFLKLTSIIICEQRQDIKIDAPAYINWCPLLINSYTKGNSTYLIVDASNLLEPHSKNHNYNLILIIE